MCEKQCRDENGFKCHQTSEQHQRMMGLFIQNPGSFMNEYSREFETKFLHLLSTRYRATKVLANTVYCDLIADKKHIHMNSTCWVSFFDFFKVICYVFVVNIFQKHYFRGFHRFGLVIFEGFIVS